MKYHSIFFIVRRFKILKGGATKKEEYFYSSSQNYTFLIHFLQNPFLVTAACYKRSAGPRPPDVIRNFAHLKDRAFVIRYLK